MSKDPSGKKTVLKKVPWTREDDKILVNYIQKNGHGSWRALPKLAGLRRSGKSCRLRWTNYLNPHIKRGSFTQQEEESIILLHAILGNKWSAIASQLPGRTDNEIKNFWSSHLKKRLLRMGLDPQTHAPIAEANLSAPQQSKALALLRHKAQWENARLEAEARLSKSSLLMSPNSRAGYHTRNSTVDIMTTSKDNPPADYFLKLWNSEAGKAFRKESSSRIISKSCVSSYHVFDKNHPNGPGYNQVLSSEIPKTPRSSASVSSSSYASTLNSCDESLNPNDIDKDTGPQQCNSASADWIGNCIVKTPELLPCFADVSVCQTGYKAPEDSSSSEKLGSPHVHYTGYSELPLDNDNNNNIGSMITELTTNFQQQSAWPWPELHLEDDSDCWSNVSFMASAHS